MQVGFVAIESGQGRAKNVRNIILKASCWYFVFLE